MYWRKSMEVPILSKRLMKIATYIPKSPILADIGSDHAYLPCYICLKDKEAKAIAGEVRIGPYERAVQTVRNYQLENKVEIRLGNGLEIISEKDQVCTVTIAGMGASLIEKILNEGKNKLKTVSRVILQPNTNSEKIREWVDNETYRIIDEAIIEENGQFYEIIVANKVDNCKNSLSIKERLFGPILLEQKSDVFKRKWERERHKLTTVLNNVKNAKEPDANKIQQLRRKLDLIEEVLSK